MFLLRMVLAKGFGHPLIEGDALNAINAFEGSDVLQSDDSELS